MFENYKIASYVDVYTSISILGPTSVAGKENVYTPDPNYAPRISLNSPGLYFTLKGKELSTGFPTLLHPI